MVSVRPVRGRAMVRQFLTMPAPLYAGDPHWVPPLTGAARRFMSARHNPYFREADIEHFVAVDEGRVVGRISTTIDHAYVARYGKVGFFGWFECVDDRAVAAALLDRAERWLAERGMVRAAGPYSYCSTQEFGLLIQGYDTMPAAFQPHNPPYYAELLHAAGYRTGFHTDTYRWDRDRDGDTMRRMLRAAEKTAAEQGLTTRPLDPRRWRSEMDIAFRLFHASFAGNHDVIPMSRPVFDYQARELRAFLDPRLTTFVERAGEPVGFSMLAADANEVLKEAGGRLSPGFLLRYRGLKKAVRGAVVLMIGADPSVTGQGVGRVLAGELAKVGLGRAGAYDHVHTTWIHQENWQSRALVARTGGRSVRRYAVLEKDLTP